MRCWVALLMLLSTAAAAEPPSGYSCSPGTAVRGVGCTCPASHREKRDAENIALCAAKPTPSVSQQLIALLEKNNLPAAIELAKKFDFKDQKTLKAVAAVFAKAIKPTLDKIDLLAARGQCSSVIKMLDEAEQWFTLYVTMGGRQFKGGEFGEDVVAAYVAALNDVFAPIRQQRASCLATASKDDGTAQIKPAYDASRELLKKCFENLPELKAPMTAKVVVDADGAVADVAFTVTWPDLDVKLINQRLEAVRLDEIAVRERCFRDKIVAWKFKPNARGFAGTIQISK